MKKISVFIIFSVIMITSCNRNEQIESFEFNGKSFSLPMTTNTAYKQFELNNNSEGITRSGDINNREVLVHTRNNDSIIGITFYEKQTTIVKLKNSHKESFSILENKYNATFKSIDFSFFTSLSGKYYYLELGDNRIIVLGDVMYNKADNNYVTTTFFKGVPVKDLTMHLRNIY